MDEEDIGTLLLVVVVLVDVRERVTCWMGDGVRRARGLLATAAFQGAHTDIFVSRKISENLVTLYDAFIKSRSLANGRPSIRETLPMRSLSASVSSKI